MSDQRADDFDDDEDFGIPDDDRDCQSCHGDGWVECRDPIQCTYPHSPDGACQCSNCGGSGLAKDQTVW